MDDEGVENLTTERVTEQRGVNIASLYHDLLNKLAMLHALAQRFAEQRQKQLGSIYASCAESSRHETVANVIDAAVQAVRAGRPGTS